jgi:membrane protease YdiL (CAAX protease family)
VSAADPGLPLAPPPRPRRIAVPWDWTDVLIVLGYTFLGWAIAGILLTSPAIVSLARSLVSSVPRETQDAVGAALTQAVLYAVAIAAVVGVIRRRRHATLADLGWRGIGWQWLVLTVAIGVIAYFGVGALAEWVAHFYPNRTNPQIGQTKQDFGHIWAVAILSDALVAPLAEETFFRGFLYGWLRRRLPVLPAVLIIGAIFAAAHFIALLFIPLMVLGVVLALVYEYSGSLIPGALIHGGFNLVNLLYILFS